MLVLHINFTY